MPIAGQGMLLTSMDIDSLHEAEFNRWYDREHLEERVAIEGFEEARRYGDEAEGPITRTGAEFVSSTQRLPMVTERFQKLVITPFIARGAWL